MQKPFIRNGVGQKVHLWYFDVHEKTAMVAIHTKVYNRTIPYLAVRCALERYLKQALPFPAKFREGTVEELTGDTNARYLWVQAHITHELTAEEAVKQLRASDFWQWTGR
jgi:hypothetical protein